MQALAVVSHNRLLQAMSRDTRSRVAPYLERVSLPLGAVISEPGARTEHMYFPINCIVSLVNTTQDRGSTEISVVGNEGALGVSLFLGGASGSRAVVQSAGTALRLNSAHVAHEFGLHADFMSLMLRYTQSLITQIAQTAVCNRLHNIDQQLCRWLLDAHDRMPGDTLEITHGLIANMLGVRREGVTGAAGKLQARGAIACRRGRVEILDRELLEELSCECYAVVKREHERLFPAPVDADGGFRERKPSLCPTCGGRNCGHVARVGSRGAGRHVA